VNGPYKRDPMHTFSNWYIEQFNSMSFEVLTVVWLRFPFCLGRHHWMIIFWHFEVHSACQTLRFKHLVVIPQKNCIVHSAVVLNIDVITLDYIKKSCVLLFKCSAVSQNDFWSLSKIRYTRPVDACVLAHIHTLLSTRARVCVCVHYFL
jgi:hypothetical protein